MKVLGFVLLLLALYLGGYLMFIKSIINIVDTIKLGDWSGVIIAWSLLKIILAGTVGGLLAYFGIHLIALGEI